MTCERTHIYMPRIKIFQPRKFCYCISNIGISFMSKHGMQISEKGNSENNSQAKKNNMGIITRFFENQGIV